MLWNYFFQEGIWLRLIHIWDDDVLPHFCLNKDGGTEILKRVERSFRGKQLFDRCFDERPISRGFHINRKMYWGEENKTHKNNIEA